MTTPRVETGAVVSMETWLLFAPFELTIIGEFSWISRSERRLQRMMTWIFVSGSSVCFSCLCTAGAAPCSNCSSPERDEGVDLVITERGLRVGGGMEAEEFVLMREGGRRVFIINGDGVW